MGAILLLVTGTASAKPRFLSDFESLDEWELYATEGCTAKLSLVDGVKGSALRMDYTFTGGGYCLIRKRLDLSLDPDFRFRVTIKGQGEQNNLEFKLMDETGENVWWKNRRRYPLPSDWTVLSQKRRHFEFAWGPSGAEKPITKTSTVEFVIAARDGGAGFIEFDQFTYEPRPPAPATPPPVRVSVNQGKLADGSQAAVLGDKLDWHVSADADEPALVLDLGYDKPIGGLRLVWADGQHATHYTISAADGETWVKLASVEDSNGSVDYVLLPDAEAQRLKINLDQAAETKQLRLVSLEVLEPEFSDSKNNAFTRIAADAPKGWYPSFFRQQQQPWTVVGIPQDERELLIDAAGAIELVKGGYRVEPFIHTKDGLITWADVETTQTLREGWMPIPTVTWKCADWQLDVSVFAFGVTENCDALIRYRLTNLSQQARDASLCLGFRPFQVLPPWQALNLVGGVGELRAVFRDREDPRLVVLSGWQQVEGVPADFAFGATDFSGGEIVEHFAADSLPDNIGVYARDGLASAGMRYDWKLAPQESQAALLRVRMHPNKPEIEAKREIKDPDAYFEKLAAGLARTWNIATNKTRLTLPASAQAVVDTYRAQQAYILINADGPAIQPGSRTYERSWIRDGALTSTALLQTGHAPAVRRFMEFYAPNQYASGKVPCVVDQRGPDPVDEHDSTGQLIHLIMQYYRYTGDREMLTTYMPYIEAGVNYLDKLRHERMTDEYRDGPPEKRRLYGLVPESISHEGYSAKPMHSYWDGFFVIRGFRDAAEAATVLGKTEFAERCERLLAEYRTAMYDSIRLEMKLADINYVPGCAELGDFDATSTAIGICPCGELGQIPEPALHNTFERYWDFFQKRRDNQIEWRDYTPYELRLMGTFVYLGQRERAFELLKFFMKDQQPNGWRQWGEVRWKDPSYPGYVGDMPHTWCGSEFLRSLRTMMVYEDYNTHALVLAAGIPAEWLATGEPIAITKWPTEFGILSYQIIAGQHQWRVSGKLDGQLPPGGMRLAMPNMQAGAVAQVNGAEVKVDDNGEIALNDTTFDVTWKAAAQ